MLKLFIASLLLLISIKAMSFTGADTGSYSTADFKAVQLQDCLEEIDAQYMDEKGMIDYSMDITVKAMIEMEEECRKENK